MLEPIKTTTKIAAELEDGTQKTKQFLQSQEKGFCSQKYPFFPKDYFDDKAFSDSVFKFLFSNTRVKITILMT